MEKELIFGLDIGTRTVIGMVGYKEGKKWNIIESVCLEHQERAMLDGQIHDIKKVEAIVRKVKIQLETKLGTKLKKVAIAAAGRVLTTQVAQVEHVLDEPKEIGLEDIQRLELMAISKAKEMLEKDKKRYSLDYLCVAYTVTNYYLDDYLMANLEGHSADKIGVQILATFLPRGVIDSLYTVTDRVDLEVTHLTLEPIAAMNAIIPEHLRLLNLALVDVGAGTSDVALSKDGSIMAYGMIPNAGDEVTEAIVHKYLVDFNTAEKIKQSLGSEAIIDFQDIIGMTHSVAREEIVEYIKPAVEELAVQIAKNIIRLNGKKSPNAVFCVGGGSQMPGLTEKLAEELELAYERVAVRTMDHVQNVELKEDISRGPQMITPTGICITAYQNTHRQMVQVTVNEEVVMLMNNKKLTMMDALTAYGVAHTEIFQTNGMSLMFKLNGERIRIKGEMGEPAHIEREGEQLSLESVIQDSDVITFKPAVAGKDGTAQLFNYIKDEWKKTIVFNGDYIDLPLIIVNGEVVRDRNQQIQKNDTVEIYPVMTIEDLISVLQLEVEVEDLYINDEIGSSDLLLMDFDKIDYKVNYIANQNRIIAEQQRLEQERLEKERLKEQKIEQQQLQLRKKLEEQQRLEQQMLQEKQKLELEQAMRKMEEELRNKSSEVNSDTSNEQIHQVLIGEAENTKLVHSQNKEEIKETDIEQEVNDLQHKYGIQVRVNGEEIDMKPKATAYMLVDIFDYIDFDLTTPRGTVKILNNNEPADVTDLIQQGDHIQIYWED